MLTRLEGEGDLQGRRREGARPRATRPHGRHRRLEAARDRLSLEHAQPAADHCGVPAARGMGRRPRGVRAARGAGQLATSRGSSAGRRSPTGSPAARGRPRAIPRCVRWASACIWTKPTTSASTTSRSTTAGCSTSSRCGRRSRGWRSTAPIWPRARRDSRQSPTRCARGAAAPSASTITRRNGSTPSSGMRSTSAGAQTRRARRGSGRRTRPAAETEKAFADFEQYVRFIQKQPGVTFVTATDLMRLYADRAIARTFSPTDLRAIAAAAQPEITFQRRQGETLSAADVFGLLTSAMAGFVRSRRVPEASRLSPLLGPIRPFVRSVGGRPRSYSRGRRFPVPSPTRQTSAVSTGACLTRYGSAPRICRRPISWPRSRPSSSASSPRDSRRPRSHAATAASRRIGMWRRTRRSCGAGRSSRGLSRAGDHGAGAASGLDLEAGGPALALASSSAIRSPPRNFRLGLYSPTHKKRRRRRAPFHESRLNAQMTRRVGHGECDSC